MLADFVRTGLKRQIAAKYRGSSGLLEVYLLDRGLEDGIRRHMDDRTESTDAESAPILAAISGELDKRGWAQMPPSVLTTIELRSRVRHLLELRFPQLGVLSYQELPEDSQIQPLTRLQV
jgi:type III secretory pathway component EscV